MRCTKYIALLATLALWIPLGAWAKARDKANLIISQKVEVGSTQLKPGDYMVEWQGSGQAVRINFLQNGKTVATADGKVVEKSAPAPSDEVTLMKVGNLQRIEEINFGGKKEAIVLVSDQSPMK